MKKRNWYVSGNNLSEHEQGLIIDEDTGANIAVTYKATDAPIMAASHDLLEALKRTRDHLVNTLELLGGYKSESSVEHCETIRIADAAIEKATGWMQERES